MTRSRSVSTLAGHGAALAALALLVAAGTGAGAGAAAGERPEAGFAYDWGVAYWMPYDNDLERGREPILKAIRKGLTNGGRTAVAVQGDFADLLGMHRMTVTAKGVQDELVSSDDSADPGRLVAYLEWFAKTFRCRKYVLVIMNHGGGLDEMCLDDLPETPGRNWMSGAELGAKLRAVRGDSAPRWELLFFQQCGRASLENLYSFRGTAEFVMASPLRIGAPNTYYTAFHRFLEANPGARGDRLAEVIARADQHYFVYTCVRGKKLAEIPRRLDAAVGPLLGAGRPALGKRPPAVFAGKVGKRPLLDAAACLGELARATGAGGDQVEAFLKWMSGELICGRWNSAHAKTADRGLSGLSFFLPATRAEAESCSDLDIYADGRLDDLWKKLHPAPKAKTATQAGEPGRG
jgi:hypothetical protein